MRPPLTHRSAVPGAWMLALAFAWGLGEATLFFIVPDVLLTLVGVRCLRGALRATLAALGGALLGGTIMYLGGLEAAPFARRLLDAVPGIGPALVARVRAELDRTGLLAMVLGPLGGIPYKIYAVEWGARAGSLLDFLLASVPARAGRFVASLTVARLIAAGLARISTRPAAGYAVLGVGWVALYTAYFARLGW